MRVFLQKQSLELRKPLLDLGSGGLVYDGKLRTLGSRVSLYVPGQACLFCQTLDEDDPGLSHISMVIPNVIAAAIGLNLLLAYLSGYTSVKNFAFFDALSNSLISMQITSRRGCLYCGKREEGG